MKLVVILLSLLALAAVGALGHRPASSLSAQGENGTRSETHAPRGKPTLQVREINTLAFACDGENHQLRALEGGERVRKLVVWFGAYGYTNADIVFTFERVSERGGWQSIAKAGWDHYAEPTGVAGQMLVYDFTPDWVEIQTDETLEFYYQCNPMDEASKTKKAHLIAFVYFWGREQ